MKMYNWVLSAYCSYLILSWWLISPSGFMYMEMERALHPAESHKKEAVAGLLAPYQYTWDWFRRKEVNQHKIVAPTSNSLSWTKDTMVYSIKSCQK